MGWFLWRNQFCSLICVPLETAKLQALPWVGSRLGITRPWLLTHPSAFIQNMCCNSKFDINPNSTPGCMIRRAVESALNLQLLPV